MNNKKPFLVMKFGGTSLGTAEKIKSVLDIVRQFKQSHSVFLVLSAMSSYKKSQGTTSRLLKITELIFPEMDIEKGTSAYTDIIESIRNDHLQILKNLISEKELLNEATDCIQGEFTKFVNFIEAVQTIEEVSTRSKDVILAFGEKLSCLVVAAVLKEFGFNAVYISLDKILPHSYVSSSESVMLDQAFYDDLSLKVVDYVSHRILNNSGQNSEPPIPVVTGFLGHIPGGLIDAVGRGYTDFTAALLSAGLKKRKYSVSELQIWKEVDGIFTADPSKVPTARLLETIYPDEAAELTYYGSEVIHPFTMEQVVRANVGIRIKNTFQPNGPGTLILVDGSANGLASNLPNSSLATAVSVKTDVICLNVRSNRKSVSHGFLAKIFSILDKYGVVVDLISTSEVHVSLVMGNNSNNLSPIKFAASPINTVSKLEKILKDMQPLGDITVAYDMAILSLVGRKMKKLVGIAGQMFTSLADAGVNIEIISQGSSEINISCVILEADATKALQEVHDNCIIGK